MINKIVASILILTIHFNVIGQYSTVKPPVELMLSLSPANLILTHDHGIGPKIEIEVKRKNYSIKLEGLKYIDINRGGITTLLDDRFEYNNGYQIGTAIHKWFNDEVFIGLNFNYKKQNYDTYYGVIYASTYASSAGLSTYSSLLTIDKSIFMFHLSAGTRVYIFNKFFIKPELEIGVRQRNVNVMGLRSPSDKLPGITHFADEEANSLRFSMLIDIKLGYQFNW